MIMLFLLMIFSQNKSTRCEDEIKYTKFPKNFLGIDGSHMTKDKLIQILKKDKAKYTILIDDPPDHWVGSNYFIGKGLEELDIKYVIYSFPDVGEINYEIELEFDGRKIKYLLNKFVKILGKYEVTYESFDDRTEYYYWIANNLVKSGVYEVFIKKKPLYNKYKKEENCGYLLIRWLYPRKEEDKYAPIHE